jgi:hypothetical protein
MEVSMPDGKIEMAAEYILRHTSETECIGSFLMGSGI